MDKDNLKKLISEGKTAEVLDEIIEFLKGRNDNELINSFILQSSQLKRNYQERILRINRNEDINISQNQIEFSVLNLIDQIRIENTNVEQEDTVAQKISENNDFLLKISTIIGRKVESFPINNEALIKHNIELFGIHLQNLHSAEKAAAKWGELVPSIIEHRIKENEEKLNELKVLINNLL